MWFCALECAHVHIVESLILLYPLKYAIDIHGDSAILTAIFRLKIHQSVGGRRISGCTIYWSLPTRLSLLLCYDFLE